MARKAIGRLLAFAATVAGARYAQAQTTATPLAAPTSSSAPTLPGLVPSGVLPVSRNILPDPLKGPALTPAAIPGDPRASMALREKQALQLRQARREPVAPVPPELEIEVLDPNVDPLGNPAVLTARDAVGRTVVDIPPVVLVHRYFYTGDRSFQGPMIPGGPSILVINHPRTGERLYIEAQMLPGAPRVFYRHASIEYDYGPQAIVLKFGLCGKPTVVYRQGTPLVEHLRQASEARHERVDRWVQRTGLPVAYNRVCEGTSNAAGAAADGARALGRAAVTPVLQIVRATPLGTIFTSDPSRQAERERDSMVRRAEAETRKFAADIPTVR